MSSLGVPTLHEHLNTIRSLSSTEIQELFKITIPSSKLPLEYLDTLQGNDLTTAHRACLLAWAVTSGTQVPRELQLRACLATHNGRDSLINAGTGSGKTLPIALNLLLDDPKAGHISLTISPLKRLQITQENDFNTRYGIPTIAINEDTPREDAYWGSHVRRIKRVHVDEAHFIHLAGLARNGTKAFRPAWGQLDELKALLPNSIPWQAISATFPPHILKTVEAKILRPNYISISISSNRPNTVYATHRVITSLDEVRNYECFLSSPFNFQSQPRVLIFFDNKALASDVAQHLNTQAPVEQVSMGP